MHEIAVGAVIIFFAVAPIAIVYRLYQIFGRGLLVVPLILGLCYLIGASLKYKWGP